MRLLSYSATSSEPVSVDEAREACRIDDAIMDRQIAIQIAAAREQAEGTTGRFYRTQTWREELTDWPASAAISLKLWNPTAVVLRYRSAASPDVWTVLSASAYRWSAIGPNTSISVTSGTSWPTLATDDYGARVQIDVTVSPDRADQAPDCVQAYILASVAAWVTNPEGLMPANMATNPLYSRLLDSERTWA